MHPYPDILETLEELRRSKGYALSAVCSGIGITTRRFRRYTSLTIPWSIVCSYVSYCKGEVQLSEAQITKFA